MQVVQVVTAKSAICLHEEDDGTLWKLTDRRLPDRPEVLRSQATRPKGAAAPATDAFEVR